MSEKNQLNIDSDIESQDARLCLFDTEQDLTSFKQTISQLKSFNTKLGIDTSKIVYSLQSILNDFATSSKTYEQDFENFDSEALLVKIILKAYSGFRINPQEDFTQFEGKNRKILDIISQKQKNFLRKSEKEFDDYIRDLERGFRDFLRDIEKKNENFFKNLDKEKSNLGKGKIEREVKDYIKNVEKELKSIRREVEKNKLLKGSRDLKKILKNFENDHKKLLKGYEKDSLNFLKKGDFSKDFIKHLKEMKSKKYKKLLDTLKKKLRDYQRNLKKKHKKNLKEVEKNNQKFLREMKRKFKNFARDNQNRNLLNQKISREIKNISNDSISDVIQETGSQVVRTEHKEVTHQIVGDLVREFSKKNPGLEKSEKNIQFMKKYGRKLFKGEEPKPEELESWANAVMNREGNTTVGYLKTILNFTNLRQAVISRVDTYPESEAAKRPIKLTHVVLEILQNEFGNEEEILNPKGDSRFLSLCEKFWINRSYTLPNSNSVEKKNLFRFLNLSAYAMIHIMNPTDYRGDCPDEYQVVKRFEKLYEEIYTVGVELDGEGGTPNPQVVNYVQEKGISNEKTITKILNDLKEKFYSVKKGMNNQKIQEIYQKSTNSQVNTEDLIFLDQCLIKLEDFETHIKQLESILKVEIEELRERRRKAEEERKRIEEEKRKLEEYLKNLSDETLKKKERINDWKIFDTIIEDIKEEYISRNPVAKKYPKNLLSYSVMQENWDLLEGEEMPDKPTIENAAKQALDYDSKTSSSYIYRLFKYPKLRNKAMKKFLNYEEIKKTELKNLIDDYVRKINERSPYSVPLVEMKKFLEKIRVTEWDGETYKTPSLNRNLINNIPSNINNLEYYLPKFLQDESNDRDVEDLVVKQKIRIYFKNFNLLKFEGSDEDFVKIRNYVNEIGISDKDNFEGILNDLKLIYEDMKDDFNREHMNELSRARENDRRYTTKHIEYTFKKYQDLEEFMLVLKQIEIYSMEKMKKIKKIIKQQKAQKKKFQNRLDELIRETREKKDIICSWEIYSRIIDDLETEFYHKELKTDINPTDEKRKKFMKFYWEESSKEPEEKNVIKWMKEIFEAYSKNSSDYLKMIFRHPKLRKKFLEMFKNYKEIKTQQLKWVIDSFIKEVKEKGFPTEEEMKNHLYEFGIEDYNNGVFSYPGLGSSVDNQYPGMNTRIFNTLQEMLDKNPCSDSRRKKWTFQAKIRIRELLEKQEDKNVTDDQEALGKVLEYVKKHDVSNKEEFEGIFNDLKMNYEVVIEMIDQTKIDEYYNLGYSNAITDTHWGYLLECIESLEKFEDHLKKIMSFVEGCPNGYKKMMEEKTKMENQKKALEIEKKKLEKQKEEIRKKKELERKKKLERQQRELELKKRKRRKGKKGERKKTKGN